MQEAKARNPAIKLFALPWTFPGWLAEGEGDNSPYDHPKVTADYVCQWVRGANSTYGLHIDYVGVWNERGYTIDYIDILRQTLDSYGFDDTAIVAHDASFDIVADILDNATLAAAVDVIGVHVSANPCTHYAHAHTHTPKHTHVAEYTLFSTAVGAVPGYHVPRGCTADGQTAVVQ